jgi:hypothetical protein
VALHPFVPQPGDPGEPEVRLGRVTGAEGADERRLVRDGMQLLAHGALVCPACALPLAVERRLPVGHPVSCGYCEHRGRARDFVREDVYDTLVNEVYVVARVA